MLNGAPVSKIVFQMCKGIWAGLNEAQESQTAQTESGRKMHRVGLSGGEDRWAERQNKRYIFTVTGRTEVR